MEETTHQNQFLNQLKQGTPILIDGAMGTMLHQRGNFAESCLEALNVSHPAVVAGIHQEYIHAGAEIILTNTFGANRYKLAHYHIQDELRAINEAGVDLVKRVAAASFKEVFIAGDVGPLGRQLYPYGRLSESEACEAFSEQIEILAEAGVDLLMLETHTNLKELLQAVKAARKIVPELPLVASMTYLRDDHTAMGNTPADVAAALKKAGVDVIGANCSGGPSQLQRVLVQMRNTVPDAVYCVMPNAGWPERSAGRIFYPDAVEYFAEQAVQFWINGASLIGGCCGTTPAHIAAMAKALKEAPLERPAIDVSVAEIPDSVAEKEKLAQPTDLARKLAEGKFVVTVEITPPHGHDTHQIEAAANFYKECGVDAINVTDSPMARMRMSPWAVCNLVQSKVGVETILHFPVRGRNLLRVQGDLLASHATGIRNVFVVMGDPTAIGEYPEAMDEYDLVPSGLIEMLSKQFNQGLDFSGKKFGEATSFFIGGALNLNPPKLATEMKTLHRKIEAGVDFLLTQPVFEVDVVNRFREEYEKKYGKLEKPILAGLMPLRDARHAQFLHNEIPGITVPEAFLTRMEEAGDRAGEVGIEIVMELALKLKPFVQGIYLMPFQRHSSAAKIIDAIRA